ncbi:hypothetical protein BK673_16160 [Pseudomonas fluorescens]|uniref:Uncharacterized protein n=1 Tax=Pseudomonas fluorescens TaxID=294 RepID=A0A423P4F9_PSEFL|nr:hypothetical protein BK673_16160 [Pseudomonas fluorescens]
MRYIYEQYDVSKLNAYPDVLKCMKLLNSAAATSDKTLYQYVQDTLSKLIEHHGLQPITTEIEKNAVQAQSYASFRYGRQLKAAA